MIAALAILRRIPAEVWAGLFLLAAIGGWTWWAYDAGHDRGRAKAAQEIAALEARVAELESANASARQVIAQLSKVNRELAEGRAADQQASAKAVADLRRDRDAMAKELAERRTERGGIYDRDQSAGAWAAARVPDSVADSLRR